MASLNRIRVLWTGGAGGEGVSTFYATPAATSALADVRDFFFAIRAFIVPSITFSFPGSGDTIESTTGQLVGGWTMTGGAPFVGNAGATSYAAGVGLRVRWGTGAIVGSRRLVGTTFITDVVTSCFDGTGTPTPGTVSGIQAAADALVATDSLVIWSRPRAGLSGFGSVESATVPDRVTALRSRRF